MLSSSPIIFPFHKLRLNFFLKHSFYLLFLFSAYFMFISDGLLFPFLSIYRRSFLSQFYYVLEPFLHEEIQLDIESLLKIADLVFHNCRSFTSLPHFFLNTNRKFKTRPTHQLSSFVFDVFLVWNKYISILYVWIVYT